MTTAEILLLIGIIIAILSSASALVVLLRVHNKNKLNNTELLIDKTNKDIVGCLDYNSDSIKTLMEVTNKQLLDMFHSSISSLNATNTQLINNHESKVGQSLNDVRDMISNNLTSLRRDNVSDSNYLREMLDKKFDTLQKEVSERLDQLRNENDKKLTEMREMVDSKLQDTLNKRLEESFNVISVQLNSLNKNLGEVQSLSSSVNALNRVMSGVKPRGMWGEVALETLLDQILTPEQYIKQATIKKNNKVDFAIRMPGKGDQEILLPIDVKCPLSDYERMVIESDACNKIGVDNARKALFEVIEREARDIRNKYIHPYETTDFAILYLPIEGLYAEIIRETGFVSRMQQDLKIIICGPTTLAALLNSLQIGFRTLAMQKSSSEIFKALTNFKKDFCKFTDNLDKTREKAEGIIKHMDDSKKRTDIIVQRLSRLEKYESEQLTEGEQDEK